MSSKINISAIVRSHLSTMRAFGGSGVSLLDVITFLIVPLLVAVAVPSLGFDFNDAFVFGALAAFSIFGGLMFNLLVLIYGIGAAEAEKRMIGSSKQDRTKKEELLWEVFYNVSYVVLVSVLCTVVFMGALLFEEATVWRRVLCGIALLLSVNSILTQIMILKRIHLLFETQFKNEDS